jgi:glycosyltransferase involved in cell wall biosynthesis
MKSVRPVILMICDYYLPGFESGGAMRTLVNMVDRLADDYEFRIVTRDHDGPMNREPYTTVRINYWNPVGQADVYYLSKNNIRLSRIKEIILHVSPDAIYLNSFFSPLTIFTLLLRRFSSIRDVPVILAPEGELLEGALSIKPLKKQPYITGAKSLHLLNNVVWKAASDYEKKAVESIFGRQESAFIAPNMPPRMILADFDPDDKPKKIRGQAKFVFMSRFMRKKNFNWFLDVIRNVHGVLFIDIFGPMEDAAYLEEFREIVKTLPANIIVRETGAVSHEHVPKTLAEYHFFVLPTLGENFGHIFIEALAAGCPLVISDRSPWRDLETQGIGWDIPLEDPDRWMSVIDKCLEMDDDEYRARSLSARNFAVGWLTDPAHEKANREVLEFALRTAR